MLSAEQKNRGLVIYGAGGHGMVVADAAAMCGIDLIGFVDDNPPPADQLPAPVLAPNDPRIANAGVIVGIGDNATRIDVSNHIADQIAFSAVIIHPTAFVSNITTIGEGTFIGAKAVVHTAAKLGAGVIVNTAALVEHHCTVGDFSHIAPNVTLGGSVSVGAQTLVGLGATVLPGITVGARCTIGAGAVVTEDVEDGLTVTGVPARPV